MKVTIVGRHSPFPARDGACSSYLVEHEGRRVLIDCGSGALSKLQRFMQLTDVTDVVLSHLHGDHTSDLMVLRYAADKDLRHRLRVDAVRVYAPPEPAEEFARLAYKDAIIPVVVKDGDVVRFGGMEFAFRKVDHAFLCHAVTVTAGGRRFAYSGDSGPCDALLEAAREADLFLCEASISESETGFPVAGHLTARQAGGVARMAGAKRLVITHLWPHYDYGKLAREAEDGFGGPVEVAVEGATYEV